MLIRKVSVFLHATFHTQYRYVQIEQNIMEEQARAELEPLIKRLKGLYQILMIFGEAHNIAKAYLETFDVLPYQLKIACSKSIITTYSKLWTHNRSEHLLNLDKTYLDNLTGEQIHGALIELRHKMTAHIDDSYEGYGVVVSGPLIENDRKDEGTYDRLRIPIGVRLESSGVFWWIENVEKITEIRDHCEKCAEETVKEIKRVTTDFRDLLLKYIPVLDNLTDLFAIREMNTSGNNNFELKDISEGNLSTDNVVDLEIDRINLKSMATIREMNPESDLNYRGNGYVLEVKGTDGNNMTFNLSFPKISE